MGDGLREKVYPHLYWEPPLKWDKNSCPINEFAIASTVQSARMALEQCPASMRAETIKARIIEQGMPTAHTVIDG